MCQQLLSKKEDNNFAKRQQKLKSLQKKIISQEINMQKMASFRVKSGIFWGKKWHLLG